MKRPITGALSKAPRVDNRVAVRRTAGQEPAVPLTVPHPTNWREAILRIVDKEQVASLKLSTQRARPLAGGAAPELLDFLYLMYKRLDGRGIPMFAHTIVRTPEDQMKLYLDGFSRDSPEDGIYPHKGCAFDLVHSKYAWDLSWQEWQMIGAVGKELAKQRRFDIVWGGDWLRKPTDRVGWDPAHWELRDFRERCKGYPFKETMNGHYLQSAASKHNRSR